MVRAFGIAVVPAAVLAVFAPPADAKIWFDMRGARLHWDERVTQTIPGCPGNTACGDFVKGITVYLRRGPVLRRTTARGLRRLGRVDANGTVRFRTPRVRAGRYHLVGRVRAGARSELMPVSATFRIVRRPAAAAAAGSACATTRANGSTPPGELGSTYHHGDGLWTVLYPGGRLVAVPPGTARRGDQVEVDRLEPDGSIGIKFPWWGDRRAGRRLVITGRRLDGPAPPLRVSVLDGSTGAPHFWATGLMFPRTGCWEVTGRSGSVRLRFVISFVDAVTDRSARARNRPSPASRGCRVTRPNHRRPPAWAPVDATHGVRGLWTILPPRGVIVAVRPGRRLTRDTVVIHQRRPENGALPISFPWVRAGRRHVRVSGRRLDGQGTLRASTRHVTHTSTRVLFPSPGCWSLTARSGRSRMTFVVFVLDEAT